MTDALITKLAQISGLRVISRSSAMQYKGINKAPPQIGAELGVQYLVDGSVVKIGDLVKVSARLINAPEDEYIWAKEYERGFMNILGLQGEIATAIAGQIKVQLTPQEEMRLAEKRPVNPETYEMYLKGMFHINKRTPEGINIGLEYLNKAVKIDPEESLAHAGLSLGYSIIAHTPKPIPGTSKLCKEAALKALELDDNLSEAHLAIAMVKIYDEYDIKAAGQSYKRALELNPDLTLALYHYAWYMYLIEGYESGSTILQKAIELDPYSNFYLAEMGLMSFASGQYDKTIEMAKKSLEVVPDFHYTLNILGCGYAGKGMYEKAIEVQKKSVEKVPFWKWGLGYTYGIAGYRDEALKIAAELEENLTIWNAWCLAVVYAGLGDADKTFHWLEKAYRMHHPYVPWMRRNFFFDRYKEDPRYESLVQRLNLTE
jgi:tetratricopeptide (TPR) repeat protein